METTSIKEIRNNLKLTQSEFANELGISRVQIGLIERGERDISEDIALKISEFINNIPEEKSGWEKYKEARNFGRIIDSLRAQGISLAQLRDKDFSVKGSDLSKMYIGLKSIAPNIKKTLVEKYNVNLQYLEYGKTVPMFSNTINETIVVPYYKGLTLKDAVMRIETHNYGNATKLSWFDSDIIAFIDLQGDNIPSLHSGKDIIGIANAEISINTMGRLFLIHLKTEEVFIRRIFPSPKADEILIRKENQSFGDLALSQKEIKSTYLVKSIYTSDFI